MALWQLPREVRDLVYDFLLVEVDASTCIRLTTGICISPAFPSSITLVSQRMRAEIQYSWAKLSKITIAGRGELCIRALTLLASRQDIWKLARNLNIDMADSHSLSLRGRSETGCEGSNLDIYTRASQVLSMCLTMPYLENIRVQITTPNTKQSLQGSESAISNSLGSLARQESMSRTYDRWHSAVRTETRFSWTGIPDVVCTGTLVHLATDRKLAPGVTLL
ncbi:hypothetical protein Q7P35_009826 [Cladosporium inversicolor]